MTPWLEQLPLWLSLAFSLVGVVVSIRLAFLAYHGVLFAFSLILTGGMLVFGFSHLLVLADPELVSTAKTLEALSSALFLAAALYMGYSLKRILKDR